MGSVVDGIDVDALDGPGGWPTSVAVTESRLQRRSLLRWAADLVATVRPTRRTLVWVTTEGRVDGYRIQDGLFRS